MKMFVLIEFVDKVVSCQAIRANTRQQALTSIVKTPKVFFGIHENFELFTGELLESPDKLERFLGGVSIFLAERGPMSAWKLVELSDVVVATSFVELPEVTLATELYNG